MSAVVKSVFSYLANPIREFLKWNRVSALAQAAHAAKDTKAGHRVYLRAITMIEIETGIVNDDNSEVKEGHLGAVTELIATQEDPQTDEERDETKVLFVEAEKV